MTAISSNRFINLTPNGDLKGKIKIDLDYYFPTSEKRAKNLLELVDMCPSPQKELNIAKIRSYLTEHVNGQPINKVTGLYLKDLTVFGGYVE